MDLSRFPRRRYTPFATPIDFLPNLTRALDGPRIYIKRDDMLGIYPGGNKTRKLEFLVADALAQGECRHYLRLPRPCLEKLPWWTPNVWTRPMTNTGKCHRGRVGIGPVVDTNNRRDDETEK